MKHIKKLATVIILSSVLLVPNVSYATTLMQALNDNNPAITNVQTQEKAKGLQQTWDVSKIISDKIESKLSEIREETERLKKEAEECKIAAEKREKGQQVADAAYHVGSPGGNLCAAWVSYVYNKAGFGYVGGNANDMYWKYCTSSNREEIMPGMIIGVPSHTHTWAGSRWGHVGIIISHDGQYYVRHNVGRIEEMTLDEWISYYGTTYTPQWGFAGGI